MLVSLAAARGARVLTLALLVQSQGVQIPAPRGLVNDFANVIPAEQEARIERIAEDVRAKSGGEIAVVTLPSLGNRTAAELSRDIGRQWGVGQKGRIGDPARNAGVVILLVPRETSGDGRTHVWISAGLGAEGFITDAAAGAIADAAAPAGRSGDYGGALEIMTQGVAERFAREFNFTRDTALAPRQPIDIRELEPERRPFGGIPPILLLIIVFIVLSMLSGGARGRRRRRRSGCGGCLPIFIPMGGGWGGGGWYGGRGWGGGGFGGGFGGGGFGGGGFGGFGGGGGFSGGGAGRSW